MNAPLRLKNRVKAHLRTRRAVRARRHIHEQSCTSLCCGKCGDSLVVTNLVGNENDASRLRDLGVREGALVTIVHCGDPLMVKVDNARFGLSRAAAENVHCEFHSRHLVQN